MSEIEEPTAIEKITTRIWREAAEPDNPFAAAICYCAGYDVYGELLSKASWIEYLYLLFKLERPTSQQAKLLEGIAIAIANPGIRDHSVRAAMNAGVGGSTHASALMAALAVGAGQYTGAREVWWFIKGLELHGKNFSALCEYLKNPKIDERADVWPEIEHIPGFDPYGVSCATPVKQTLAHLESIYSGGNLSWVLKNQSQFESTFSSPLAMTAVIATAMHDLDLSAEQSEMLFLFLRLPGAAVHALEQEVNGHRKYPFFKNGLILEDDPLYKSGTKVERSIQREEHENA